MVCKKRVSNYCTLWLYVITTQILDGECLRTVFVKIVR